MIDFILEKLGLNKTEIKVYKTLLQLGEAKTGQILKKSGLNSGRIYEVLNSLEDKGLVSFVIRSGVKHFTASNPNRVLDFINEKKSDLIQQEAEYKKILPSLLNEANNYKSDLKVEIYQGMKGLKTAYLKEEAYYSSKETIYVFGVGNQENYPKEYFNFFKYEIYPKRNRTKLKIKKIFSMEARSNVLHEKNAKVRYLPYFSPVIVGVINKLITIGIPNKEPLTISIESKEIAASFIEQFEFLWKIAKI